MTNGTKALLDPFGGLCENETGQYVYQKRTVNNLFSECVTLDVAVPLADMLKTVGCHVYSSRCLEKTQRAGRGVSGMPLDRECASLFLRTVRVPPSMRKDKGSPFLPESLWNEGATGIEKDLNARLNYAKFLSPDITIGIDVSMRIEDVGVEAVCSAGAEELADSVLDEVCARTRQRRAGVREPSDDRERAYAGLSGKVVVLICGSAFDPRMAARLREGWYRELISLGIFSALYKSLT
jgi:hypothetical protein